MPSVITILLSHFLVPVHFKLYPKCMYMLVRCGSCEWGIGIINSIGSVVPIKYLLGVMRFVYFDIIGCWNISKSSVEQL